MTSNLTSIKFKPSRYVLLTCFIMCIILNVLIKLSTLSLWIKFGYSSCCILSLFYAYFIIQQTLSIDQCDILFDIRTIICWKENQMEMYNIDSWYTLANFGLFISLSNSNNKRTLFITKDSCDIRHFNAIMRYIKWHK